jgi:hypothetical protein
LFLRSTLFVVRTLKSLLTRCVDWRRSQALALPPPPNAQVPSQVEDAGALEHLGVLFQHAMRTLQVLKALGDCFQERMVLKMHLDLKKGRRLQTGLPVPTSAYEKLMFKVHGQKHQKRKPISKMEAKLLPYFYHAIEDFEEFLSEEKAINNLEAIGFVGQEEEEEKYKEVNDTLLSRQALEEDQHTQLLTFSDLIPMENFVLDQKLLEIWQQQKEPTSHRSRISDEEVGEREEEDEEEEEEEEDRDTVEELIGQGSTGEDVGEEEDEVSDVESMDGFAVRRTSNLQASFRQEMNSLTKKRKNEMSGPIVISKNEDIGFSSIVIEYKKNKKARQPMTLHSSHF